MKIYIKILTLTAFIISTHTFGFAGQPNKLFSTAKTIAVLSATAFGIAEVADHMPIPESLVKKLNHIDGEASPALHDFVQEIMAREGLKNPHKIKVYTRPDYGVAAAGKNGSERIIVLDNSTARDLERVVSNPDRNVYSRNNITATLVHEAAHLKYNHQKKTAALLAFSGFFFSDYTTPSFSRLQTKLPKLAFATKLLCAAMHLEFWHLVNKAYWRTQEFEADDAITRPDEIRAHIVDYERHWSDKPPKEPLELLKYTVESLHRTHPHNYERIERFEKRLQESE